MKAHKLKILLLEDFVGDADMVESGLKKSGMAYTIKIADNKNDYEKYLDEFLPDIVLSDHSLPSFNSLEALSMMRDKGMDIPFILVTATVSEEFAVDIMKRGAADYILKDRLQRLPIAIMNAVEKWSAEKEKKTSLQNLEANEKKFRALIENNSDIILLMSFTGDILYCSPSLLKVMGYAPEEWIGKKQFDCVHPEDVKTLEAIRERANGSPAETFYYKCRVLHKNGSYRWCEGTLTNLLDESSVSAFVFNFRDVTEMKLVEDERERTTTELIKQNKDLEQFAYIVSHNLRSPVANILGLAHSLNHTQNTDEEKKFIINGISSAVQKLDEIIIDLNQVLNFSRAGGEKREPVKIPTLINDIKVTISDQLTKTQTTIVGHYATEEIMIQKSYLFSVLFNLISNSIKYRRENVSPVIEIKTFTEKDKIKLVVQDNGVGIDMEKYQQQVFGLYKRFHTHVEGKGMGLFMVKTQVEAMGGTITVKSTVNQGTVFTMEFPV